MAAAWRSLAGRVRGRAGMFSLADYDCVGFDLDNTICRYKLSATLRLESSLLADYLVRRKGYDARHLLAPFHEGAAFLKKGLLLDFDNGNVLQVGDDGRVQRASHGTRFMGWPEVEAVYGSEGKWKVTQEYTRHLLEAWNGPLSAKVRTLLDYFDMPASLAFARCVDAVDAADGGRRPGAAYRVWPDVLDGLVDMYRREGFSADEGGFFPELKRQPEAYVHRCSDAVLHWLRAVKEQKTVFLLTGSHADFASLSAHTSMGEDWRSLFHVVVCYARKPGFFTGNRPFLKLDGAMQETDPVSGPDLQCGGIYSQGNWQDLRLFLGRTTGKSRPRCIYIGDNLIQDVYVPSQYAECDTVSVVEEMAAEGMAGCSSYRHGDAPLLASPQWGSYFGGGCSNLTLWGDIIRRHSKICVPSLDYLAAYPPDHRFSPFADEGDGGCGTAGYHPGMPLSLQR